jgi:hypothetical protein
MPEHYTKNTLECTAWCKKCQRNTQHRVDGGRRGPCLEHQAEGPSKKQIAQEKKREKAAMNPRLFE